MILIFNEFALILSITLFIDIAKQTFFMNVANDKKTFITRFVVYQKERFPFLVHGLLIASFSFSAIGYSRLCRGVNDFIPLQHYFHCVFITVTLFFLVRIFDEFKDKEDDAAYRKYLPVPRGLVTLSELKIVGLVTFALQMILIVFFKWALIYLYAFVMLYLCIMGVEFFIPNWLKRHQFWYVVSHMFIIPFIDMYASSYDWKLLNILPPTGLVFFFIVSYLNGIVIEIGRKIRTPATEEPHVKSYTIMLGTKNAVYTWLLVLLATLFAAILAAQYARHGSAEFIILICLFIITIIPSLCFLKNVHSVKATKWIEYASILWTFGMYLSLGGIPMLIKLFKS